MGFDTDFYLDNTQVDTRTVCGPPTIGGISGTKYLTLSGLDASNEVAEESKGTEFCSI